MVRQDTIDFTETHEFDKFIDLAGTAQWVVLKIIDKICAFKSRDISLDVKIRYLSSDRHIDIGRKHTVDIV